MTPCPRKPGVQCSDPDRFKGSTPCPGCGRRTPPKLGPRKGEMLGGLTSTLAKKMLGGDVRSLPLISNFRGHSP